MNRTVALAVAAIAATAAVVVAAPANATLTPGPAPTLSSTTGLAKALKCTYDLTQWPGGFMANLTIANSGPDINGWTARWTFKTPTTLLGAWTSTVVQFGPYQVVAGNATWNAIIKTGQATTFGWTASAAATEIPTDITVNGLPC